MPISTEGMLFFTNSNRRALEVGKNPPLFQPLVKYGVFSNKENKRNSFVISDFDFFLLVDNL